VEAEDQHFAVKRLQGKQSFGYPLSILARLIGLKGGGTLGGHVEGTAVFACFAHGFQAAHSALPPHVDDQVAGDGEQPGIESGLAIELIAALQYPHPGFLENIFCHLPVPGEVEEVTQQAMLILNDELIEQLRIVALEALGNDSVLVVGLIERGEGSYSHIILKDARSLSKDAPNDHISEFTGQGHAPPKPGRCNKDIGISTPNQLDAPESKLGVMEILFGLHPVEEALRSGTRKFDHICIARERQDVRLEKLIQACRDAGVRMRMDTRDQLTKLARTEAHQGVVAIVRERQFLDLDDLLKGNKPDRLLLALDGVEDPQNLGALLRTAEGAGVDGVVVTERRSAPLSPVAVKASAGAAEHVKIARVVNLVRTLEELKKRDLWIIGLDERGSMDYDQFDFSVGCALVMGREGAGLHDLVRRTCDHLLRIPMAGRVASLNVSAAGAVVLYEAARQRRNKNRNQGQPAPAAKGAKKQKGLGS
jgi:23S rRNA (guanosine2251-2'-O)-methyltransferase